MPLENKTTIQDTMVHLCNYSKLMNNRKSGTEMVWETKQTVVVDMYDHAILNYLNVVEKLEYTFVFSPPKVLEQK